MEVIFLIGSTQALFFAILIFNKKSKSISDKILASWLLLFAFHLIFPFLLYKENYKDYIYIGGVDAGFLVLHASLLYIYTKSLISKKNYFKKSYLWNIIPFVITYISMIPYFILTYDEKLSFYEGSTNLPSYMYIMMVLMFTFIIFYLLKTLILIKNHRKNIKHIFSYQENINLHWLRNLIISFSTIIVVGIVIIALLYANQINIINADFYIYLLLALFVYCIGYWGYKQGRVFSYQKPLVTSKNDFNNQIKKNDFPIKEQIIDNGTDIPNINEPKTILNSSDDETFVKKLFEYMQTHKPYLDGNLSLHELSHNLDVPMHYLSHILNNNIELNFYEFINNYRVDAVKKSLKENNHLKFTLLTIALECGFNSKASFNRIFKNTTGLTPSEYQKTLKESH